ncbi:hypothetical protein VE03_08986, partial [Pseudogymnoascus sp. 23342-1-I1]
MNTQIHSTIGCAPAELLFRDRSSHIDWLNSQARKDLSIGVEQEDLTLAPIFESELHPEPEALIDPRLRQAPELELGIELSSSGLNSEPGSGSKLNSELRVGLRIRARAGTRARAGLRIEFSRSELNSGPSSGLELNSEPEPEPELNSELRRGARARVPAQPRTELPDPIIEKAIASTQRARVSMI